VRGSRSYPIEQKTQVLKKMNVETAFKPSGNGTSETIALAKKMP